MNRRREWLLAISVLMLVMLGCTKYPIGRIDVRTRNVSAEDINEVAVWFGDAPCTSGYLVANGQATYLYFEAPITSVARVEWKDGSGRMHSMEVKLSDIVGRGDSGLLQFSIKGDDVEAELLPLPASRG